MHVTLRNPNCQKTVLDNGATLDPALAYEACLHAGNFREGNHGAGDRKSVV